MEFFYPLLFALLYYFKFFSNDIMWEMTSWLFKVTPLTLYLYILPSHPVSYLLTTFALLAGYIYFLNGSLCSMSSIKKDTLPISLIPGSSVWIKCQQNQHFKIESSYCFSQRCDLVKGNVTLFSWWFLLSHWMVHLSKLCINKALLNN